MFEAYCVQKQIRTDFEENPQCFPICEKISFQQNLCALYSWSEDDIIDICFLIEHWLLTSVFYYGYSVSNKKSGMFGEFMCFYEKT